MTPYELKNLDEAIEYVHDFATDVDEEGLDREGNARHFFNVVNASRTLSQLMHGTHPDLVVVPREPTRKILEIMADCERGDLRYTPKEAWLAMIAAAQKVGE